jgi:hypothetical protein
VKITIYKFRFSLRIPFGSFAPPSQPGGGFPDEGMWDPDWTSHFETMGFKRASIPGLPVCIQAKVFEDILQPE